MIGISQSAVTVLRPDGTSAFLDAGELQARVVDSCLRAGIREPWFAEDLVMAVEHALSDGGAAVNPTFSSGELDAIVAKALEDAGLPEAADQYRRIHPAPATLAADDPGGIARLLARRMGLSGPALAQAAAYVAISAAQLGIARVPYHLAIELAKLRLSGHDSHAPAPAVNAGGDGPVWLARTGEIAARLPKGTGALAAAGALAVLGVSALFPAVKIELDLSKWCLAAGLAPPVTEMAIMPRLPSLAAAVDGAVDTVHGLLPAHDGCPVFLTIRGVRGFATTMLGGEWPRAGETVLELAAQLRGLLRHQVFRLTMV